MLTPFDTSMTAMPTYFPQAQMNQGGMSYQELLLYLQSLLAQPGFPGMTDQAGGSGGMQALAPADFGNSGSGNYAAASPGSFLGSGNLSNAVGNGYTGASYPSASPAAYSPTNDFSNSLSTPSVQSTPSVTGTLPSLSHNGQGRIAVANEILGLHESGRISLMGRQVSGVRDQASSLHTIQQAATGTSSLTSNYGHAHGRATNLDARMLDGMRSLADKYSFSVSSIAGGKHSDNSRHYAGLAFDVNSINGQKVNSSHPDYKAFMADARKLGATEVLGPGTAGHSGHVHVAWSRQGAQNHAYTEAELAEHQENLAEAKAELEKAETPEQLASATDAVEKAQEGVDKAQGAVQDSKEQNAKDAESRDKQDSADGSRTASADNSGGSRSADSGGGSRSADSGGGSRSADSGGGSRSADSGSGGGSKGGGSKSDSGGGTSKA